MDKLKNKIILLLCLEILAFTLMKSRLIDKEILGFVVFLTFVAFPIALYLYTNDLLIGLNTTTQFTTSKERVFLRLLAALPFIIFIIIIGGFGSTVIVTTLEKFSIESLKQTPFANISVIFLGLIFFMGAINMCRNLYGSSTVTSPVICFKSAYYAESLTKNSIQNRDFHSWFKLELNKLGYKITEKATADGFYFQFEKQHTINFLFNYSYPDSDFDHDYEDNDEEELPPEDFEFYISVSTSKQRFKFEPNTPEEIAHKKLYQDCCQIVQSNQHLEILQLEIYGNQ